MPRVRSSRLGRAMYAVFCEGLDVIARSASRDDAIPCRRAPVGLRLLRFTRNDRVGPRSKSNGDCLSRGAVGYHSRRFHNVKIATIVSYSATLRGARDGAPMTTKEKCVLVDSLQKQEGLDARGIGQFG